MLKIRVRAASLRALALAATAFAVATCDGDLDQESGPADLAEIVAAVTVTNPQIDFSPTPSYLPAKSIVLTFDDGPDSTNTAKVLDTLKSNGLKATFFINTINFTDVNTDANAQNLVRRIVNEGHTLANHSVHHPDLAGLSAAQIETEIAGVENTVANVLGPRRLTLFRAPYGSPFDPNGDTSQLGKVAPVVGRHAVHIGWNITPQDFNCGDATCVFNNVKNELVAGHYGVILLHCVQPQTAAALQNIINYARANGYTFRSVEDAVVGRYGAPSGDLIGSGGASDVLRIATADAYVRDGATAATNFGTVTPIGAKKSTLGFNRITYLNFSISNLASLTTAKLQIWGKLSAAASVPVSVSSVATTTWSETGLTWNNRPAPASAALATGSVSSTTLTKLEFDVGNYVKSQRTAGKTVVSFAVQGTAITTEVAQFNSREASSNKPTLALTP
jgi:peptidoglycan/xylan/chitin deacetylase (PgdA/CDA1 family)